MRGARALLVAGLCGAVVTAVFGASASGQTDAPGVTNDTVKLGFISSETGPASTAGKGAADGCKARVGRANAQGGVNGRRIEVEYHDDQSSPGTLDLAKNLVQNRKVFAVINETPLAFLSYRYLVGEGVPMIGSGADGDYYFDKGNEMIFSTSGAGAVPGLTWDWAAKMMKKLGATKVGAVAYGVVPSSAASAKSFYEYAGPANGLKPAYLNTSLEFGATDVGAIVLAIKSSGADGLYLPLNPDTNFAIAQGLLQNNVPVKAVVLATGYSQDLLDSPVAEVLGPRHVFFTAWRPIELGGPAIKRFQADREKYTGQTDVPTFGTYQGYVGCDMAIYGLQHADKTLSRQGFVDAIRNGHYDGAGLNCNAYDLSYESFGKLSETSCVWFVAVKNGTFKVLNNGKGVSGTLRGDPKLLAQYTSDAGSVSSTTAAPPR